MSRASTPLTPEDARAADAALWSARLAEGPLAPEDRADFQAWLDRDPANAEAMDAVVDAWRDVEAHASAPELLELRKRALASAQKAQRERRRRPHAHARSVWRWSALAAASLAVAVTGFGFVYLTPKTYATGLGERRVVALADGSRVSLDAQTTVRVRYAFGRRRLWLDRGRAKFDVAKDPLHPFTVDAGAREVVATGTSFSVELVRKDVRVVLYEGHVAVLDRSIRSASTPPQVAVGPDRLPADRALAPGRELVVRAQDAGAAPATVAPVDPVRSLAWEGGQLVFEDEPLSTAVERMDRYAATPLVVGDPGTARVRISGVFRAGDTSSFVQGLTAAFPVTAHEKDGRIVLTGDTARKNRGG